MNKLHLFLLLLLAPLLPSCNGDEPEAEDGAGPIKIGHFASLQGDNATFGQQVDKGIQLAVEEINANGGINGRQLELITEDTRSVGRDATMAAQKLISKDEVVVLLGEVASSLSLAAVPIAERTGTPMVTPASTNPRVTVTEAGQVRDNIFRVCFIDPFQGRVMAKFARENLGVDRVAILKDAANDYSVGLAQNFREVFTELGGEIAEEQAYQAKDKDFKSQLTAIRAANPEAIFVPGYYGEVSLIATQARELGIDVPLLGGDGWDSPQLTQGEAREALEGCFFSNHYSVEDTTARVKDFTTRYQEHFNEQPGAMSALGYDAMMIVADVLRKVNSTEPEAIIEGLNAVENYPGVTGDITINDQHNAEKPAVVLQIKDGKFAYHTTVKP